MDWAVVCTTKSDTTLLVFAHGAEQPPMELVKIRNGLYADMSVTALSRQSMADYLTKTQTKPGQPLPPLAHDAISYWLGPRNPDSRSFSDNAMESGVLYFDGSKWTHLTTMIAN